MPRSLLLAFVGLLSVTSVSVAQRPPDAGSILRDFRRTTPPPPQPVLPPPETAPSAPESGGGGERVLVKDFRIRGATQFSETTLKDLLKGFVGRELTLADLRDAAFRISEFYRQHDVLGRAVIPRQDIRDGVVEIDVIEGTLGGATVDPSSITRLAPDIAKGIVEFRAPPGQVVRPSRLQEGVSILNEIPGVAATGTMQPGHGPGETAIDLQLRDRPLFSGSLEADNQGAHFIGSDRGLVNLAANDPFGRGEQISVLGVKTGSSIYGRAAAQMPVGYSGLTLGVNQSYLSFDLEGPFQTLNEGGYAYSTGAAAAYPFRRLSDFALTGFATFDHRHIVDRALEADLDNRMLEIGQIGVAATVIDSWLGGGANDLGARVSVGGVDRSGNATDLATDAQTARTNGVYAKLNLSAYRVQRLNQDMDLYLAASGQVAERNLDTSEKFSLGGPYGVRAYPINEGNGDDGALVTVELRRRLPVGLTVFALYDAGAIRVNYQTWQGWQVTPGEPNHYLLQGAGAGIAWIPVPAVQTKLTYAHTIGPNPGHDANGNNADGRHSHNQFWLIGRVVF